MGHPAHVPAETDDLNAIGGHCPRCGAEYRPGFHECADCNVPLVPGPAPQRAPSPSPEGPRQAPQPRGVAAVCSLPWEEAWLMAGRLRTTGIDAAVSPDVMASYSLYRRRGFDVLVPADREEEARRVVGAFIEGTARSP